MYVDKTLICKDCGKEFIFSASEQEFYAIKKFEHEPVRCKECRKKYREQTAASSSQRPMHPKQPLYAAVCSDCGKKIELSFLPRTGRPVYCKECLKRHKRNAQKNQKEFK